MKRRSLLVLASLYLLACQPIEKAGMARDSSASQYLFMGSNAPVPRTIGYDAAGRPAPVELEGVVVTGDVLPMPAVSSMVIRTATASVKVDSLEPAVAAVRELAARVGGFVTNTGIQTGEGQLRSATIK